MVNWELAGEITHQETFAEGSRIRELHRLVEAYGVGKRWKKRKGFGRSLPDAITVPSPRGLSVQAGEQIAKLAFVRADWVLHRRRFITKHEQLHSENHIQ